MSRGLGKQQRKILAAVQQYGAIYLASLAKDMSDYKGLYRAACKLHDAGRIGLVVFRYAPGHGSDGPKVTVCRADTEGTPDRRRLIELHKKLRAGAT